MRFISCFMLIGLAFNALAAELPRFGTKLNLETLRFVSKDGKFSYAQKRSGALSMVSGFKTTEIITNPPGTNYLVSSSQFRKKVAIEIEANPHRTLDLRKINQIWVADMGSAGVISVGKGRFPRLHLNDEWLTWFDPKAQTIHVQFLPVAKRHYVIRLGVKHNPYFMPEVLMLNQETVMYTDINERGIAALLSYNLLDNKVTVVAKAELPGTRMEICSRDKYAALGEFSYMGARRGTSIKVMAWKVVAGIGGFTQVYRSQDNDLGQMVCGDSQVWFIKTLSEDRELNGMVTEAAFIDVTTSKLEVRSNLERVTNLIEMDGRILIPFRDETYVVSGDAGSTQDNLVRPQARTP